MPNYHQASDRASPFLFRTVSMGFIAAGWLSAWLFPWEYLWEFNTCFFRRLTGIPCPFCFLTHSCVHASNGRIAEAFSWNPLGPFLMLASIAVFLWMGILILRESPASDISGFLKRHRWITPMISALWVVNWLYVIYLSHVR